MKIRIDSKFFRKQMQAIHSYFSAKVLDLSNIVKQYNGYHKIENLIIHVGHNNID